MSKRMITALVLIALMVIAMLLNAGHNVRLDLVVTTIRVSAAMAYLGFAALGVVVGILLR